VSLAEPAAELNFAQGFPRVLKLDLTGRASID
jgi:hypothetical protein